MKLAGIDIGNDSVKIVLDGSTEPIIVPNIVAPGYDRAILQFEESPLQALDVSVSVRNCREMENGISSVC